MRETDGDALLCDFAETYHIYDIDAVPILTAAALAMGLPDSSRIKRKMSGVRHGIDTQLLAILVDHVKYMHYMLSDPKSRGKVPDSTYESLMNGPSEKRGKYEGYSSIKEFEAARQKIFQSGGD